MSLQIVADFDQNRRASITVKKLHSHANDGVRVARAKNGVDLFHEEEPEERPNHPDRFPSCGWKRFSHNTVIEVRNGTGTCPAASTKDHDRIMPRFLPMFGKPQRNTLHPAWFEAMDRNGNPHVC
ncbi:hypothetical protein GCM10011329_37520 [Stakelama pacifica]|nr:hypothetical protein GCM10011329_37520 [Stakelama pacifica]